MTGLRASSLLAPAVPSGPPLHLPVVWRDSGRKGCRFLPSACFGLDPCGLPAGTGRRGAAVPPTPGRSTSPRFLPASAAEPKPEPPSAPRFGGARCEQVGVTAPPRDPVILWACAHPIGL